MEFYWELKQYDGTVTMIPPQYVTLVKRRWGNGQPIDLGQHGSISAKDIKSFHPSNRPYGAQQLLESAAQVFNEPVDTAGGIAAKWVKRSVTSGWWEKHYSRIPGYQKLGEDGAMVIVGFRLPVHQIVGGVHQECTSDEIKKLTQS